MIDDSELRRRFTELRETDRNRTPGFARTYGDARARRSRRATRGWRPLVLAAAAVVVIAALSLAYGRSTTSPTITPAIATWRAPTDVLLQTPGSELLGVMPALSKSILDEMIPIPSNKGI
ncbi:MAG: hypothetical protein ACXWMM_13110 [Gemmatimonadaceae bacterium]